MPKPKQPTGEELNQRLVEQYTEIARLAGSLAHEIKNPLSVIRMNMDLLAEDFSDAQTRRERRALKKIDVVQSQCERLENLLDDFLVFSRVRKLNLRAANLNEQVERVLEFFAPQAEEAGIEIIRYFDPDLPSITLDSEMLHSALLNLILNAAQAMSHGGNLWIRTRTTRSGVALDLIDTGCGMSQETALHMFEAFYSTKDGGSGLGLPTTKKIIEAHGGQIAVQSERGRGTQVTLEFPVPARLTTGEKTKRDE